MKNVQLPSSALFYTFILLFNCANTVYADINLSPSSECTQPRFIGQAPSEIHQSKNPLEDNKSNLKSGKKLYLYKSKPVQCFHCHGKTGDGKGSMAEFFKPPLRNFACVETVNGVPDGQLFWIIENGLPGTSMPSFKKLSDNQIWQLVLYLRHLANQ